MAFPMLDTPRTELGDQTRLSAPDDTTENSIPSPSKDANSLLNQIRGLRQPARQPQHQTPRTRIPLLDRRNAPAAKNEFTPLLKSATKNRQFQLQSNDQENNLQTPAGLRNSYHSGHQSSPALPLGSSVLLEEHTGSEYDQSREAPALPASSSPASTPMARENNGVLEHGNMATLREQEARLEQIDKENFSLKLKIHFLEEALRRNGKEFNENALRENTELKVDKVTLQRDLKQYRKQLVSAEKELEDYKRQLLEYAETVKRRHADEGMLEEMERLRAAAAERDALVDSLRRQLDEEAAESGANAKALQEMEELKETISDLEADLRDRDRRLDEREDEIERLKEQSYHDDEAEEEIQDLKRTVTDLEQQMREKDLKLRSRDDEIGGLKKQAAAGNDHDKDLKAELDQALARVDDLQQEVQTKSQEFRAAGLELDELREELNKAGNAQKDDMTNLKDTIADLEADVRERERRLDERDDEIERLKETVEDAEAEIRDKERSAQSLSDEVARLKEQANRDDGAQAEIDHLQQQLKAKDGESQVLEQARRELDGLRRKLSERDQELRRLKELQQQLDHLRRQLEEKNDDIEGLRDALSRAGAETAAKLREKDRILEEKDDDLRELEDQLQAMGQDQSANMHHKDDSISERDTRIKRLQKELDDLQGKLDDAEADLRSSQRTTDEKDDQLDNLKLKLQQMENETDEELISAQDRIQELEIDLERTSAKMKQMEQTSSNNATTSTQVRTELEKARVAADELRRTVERHVAEIQRLTTEKQQVANKKDVKIQELEDDLEYGREQEANLQAEARRLRERVQQLETKVHDHTGRQSDVDNLRANVTELERQMAEKNATLSSVRRELAQANRTLSTGSDKESQLQRKIQDLEDELEMMQVQAEDDAARVTEEKATLQSDVDALRRQMREAQDRHDQARRPTSPPRSDLQPCIDALKREKNQLQDELDATFADYRKSQGLVQDLEQGRVQLEREIRDLNGRLQTSEREFERKLESQVAAYELDVRNLEQDLADAESKGKSLGQKNEHAEAIIQRLRSKIALLEADVNKAQAQPSPSSRERGDLHQMLKNAKLEAEDLAIQIQERDRQMEQNAGVETDLRTQLDRLRKERNLFAQQAETLHRQAASKSNTTSAPDASLIRRHQKELAGLAKQIEYLAARVRREQRFRADLQHTKHYYQKNLEMHARCNNLDLRLVRDMGIPVKAVYRNERERERLECAGRVQLRAKRTSDGSIRQRSRPTLKVVALMVLAGVRMQREAAQWDTVRRSHDDVLRKLQVLRRMREDTCTGSVSVRDGALGKRKTAK